MTTQADLSERKDYQEYKLTQAEAEYTVPASDLTRSCGACRFYRWENSCHLVASDPAMIVAHGGCTKFHARPHTVEDGGQALLEAFRDLTGALSSIDGGKGVSFIQRVQEGLSSALGVERPNVQGMKTDDGRFLGWWSNNFKDREREIISMKALRRYIDAANSGAMNMPELWWMHIPHTGHGRVDGLFTIGHFALATGKFYENDNPLQDAMMKWYSTFDGKEEKPTMSHQFYYDQRLKRGNTYWDIAPFEISSLVPDYEANRYTSFSTVQMLERILA